MKVIVSKDEDAISLLNRLELVKLRRDYYGRWDNPEKPPTVEEVHRAFHYEVVRWLQEQGFKVTP